MTEFDPIADPDPARPDCVVARAALQRMLDREANWDTPEAAAHRAGCVACREELVLAGMFAQLPATVVVPIGLTDQMVNTAIAARRRRLAVRFAAGGLALAASVVVAVLLLQGPAEPEPNPGPVVIAPEPKVEPAPPAGPQKPLGDSVSEARDAIVSLTRRTAAETRDQSVRLIPEPRMPETPDGGLGLDPLADAGTGAARSVEPLRDSARRAVNFFLRAADPPERRN